MRLFLKKGEYKWSEQGVHICDEHGYAVVCEADCEVEIISEEAFVKAQKIVAESRALQGSAWSSTFSSSSSLSVPEELPEQLAPEESPQVHAEPEPQEHGQETSEAPEMPSSEEQSVESPIAPE